MINKEVPFEDATVYTVKKDMTGLEPFYYSGALFRNATLDTIYYDIGAPGTIAATGEPIFLQDAALYEGRLISPATLRLAHTPATLPDGSSTDYGFGWGIHQYQGMEILEHGGNGRLFAWHPASRSTEQLLAGLTALYTMFAGFYGVVITDLIQGVIIIISCMVIAAMAA